MWIVLQMTKPRTSLRGYCRRFLLEPASNLFVGKATKPLLGDLERRVRESGIDAVLIYGDKKTDMGMVVTVYGKPSRTVEDLDGLQIICRNIKKLV